MTTTTVLRSKLNVYDESDPQRAQIATTDASEIARLLAEIGVRFERWDVRSALPADADNEQVLAAYDASVKQVQRDGGYETVDVLRLKKGTPNTEPVRKKFLDEHIHTEDEVRFFVEGSGAFYLHVGSKVYQAICVRGDLISVPAGIPHWFDMGPDPEFTAVRWFNNQEGWVPQYSGAAIAERFPKYE